MKLDINVSGNFIGGRQGFAYICNSGKFSVLKADTDKEQEYKGYNQFEKVRVAWNHRNQEIHSTGTLVCENGDWSISGGGACIHSGFSFHDRLEDIENANLPILKANDVVAIALLSKKHEFVLLQLYKVGRVNPNCMTMAKLTALTNDEMKEVVKDATEWCNR